MARDSSIKLIEIPELFFPIFFCFASYKFALSPKVETRERDMNFKRNRKHSADGSTLGRALWSGPDSHLL